MATKLLQKRLFFLTQEFELVGDEVKVRIRSLRREEEFTVLLTVLNPEPVIKTTCLEFISRVNGETLVSLLLGKPNTKEFNAFVGILRERAKEAYNTFAGLRPANRTLGLAGNIYDEPPEYVESESGLTSASKIEVDAEKVDTAIRMLSMYLNSEETRSLISALEALKSAPRDEARLDDVVFAFSALGVAQGAALTYAPYLSVLLSDRTLNTR